MKKIIKKTVIQEAIALYTDASFSNVHSLAITGSAIVFGSLVGDPEGFKDSYRVELQRIQERNNIRSEIRGALAGLLRCPKGARVTLYTDCKAISELPRRREALEASGYISKAKNMPLANGDLYREFFRLSDTLQLSIIWVKGHTKAANRGPDEAIFSSLDKIVRQELRRQVS